MYEVQLQYRNAAFAHVARVLYEEYGENWFEEQVRGIFTTAEWDSLEANVSERYATAGLSIRVPLPYEWLGVSHLGGMIEKHGRHLIAGARSLQPQPRHRRVQSVARLCHQFRAVRDPVAHPPSEELSLRDLAFYTQMAQRVLQELGLDEEVDRLEEILLDAGKPPSTNALGKWVHVIGSFQTFDEVKNRARGQALAATREFEATGNVLSLGYAMAMWDMVRSEMGHDHVVPAYQRAIEVLAAEVVELRAPMTEAA